MRFLGSLLLLFSLTMHAQWQLQDSHTTADFRGIDYVGNGIAWVSGNRGTVLRTEDMGHTWQRCATPSGAEELDFRGVQAFDANTAIVMSSGKGELSRLYKTVDGCRTWKLVFTNPDKDGFWDAVKFVSGDGRELGRVGYLVGDPIQGSFAEFITYSYGAEWDPIGPGVGSLGPAKTGEAMFAASNSSLQLIRNTPVVVTGGAVARLREVSLHIQHDPRISYEFVGGEIPLSRGKAAGAFSFSAKLGPDSVAEADFQSLLKSQLMQVTFSLRSAETTQGLMKAQEPPPSRPMAGSTGPSLSPHPTAIALPSPTTNPATHGSP